ncbi:MAG: enoyl-CoA hydratase-related protein [Candidatus Baltobacteraceae bacterium]
MDTIAISATGGVARVLLARPDVRNAFNADVIRSLRDAFSQFHADRTIRAIVLAGEGKSFCGGADINWMRGALDLSYDANVADAEAMSDMFRAIDRCSKPVVGRIHGAALGGGAGLAAVCDVAIASDETIFGFTEVKLGIIPAVISPFVLAKIGMSHARALFLTGERFNAERARAIGLVHEVVPASGLEGAVERVLAELLTAGPLATAAAKKLIAEVSESSYPASRGLTAAAIAKQRAGDEGQEGLRAFLERRAASFAQ